MISIGGNVCVYGVSTFILLSIVFVVLQFPSRTDMPSYWPTISEAALYQPAIYAFSMTVAGISMAVGSLLATVILSRSLFNIPVAILGIIGGAGLAYQGVVPLDLEALMDSHRAAAAIFFVCAFLVMVLLTIQRIRVHGKTIGSMVGVGTIVAVVALMVVAPLIIGDALGNLDFSRKGGINPIEAGALTAAALCQYALVGSILCFVFTYGRLARSYGLGMVRMAQKVDVVEHAKSKE